MVNNKCQIFELSNVYWKSVSPEIDTKGSSCLDVKNVFSVSKEKFIIERPKTLTIWSFDVGIWQERNFSWNGAVDIISVARNSADSFVLVVNADSEVFIVPTEDDPQCNNWRSSEVTHFGVQSFDTRPPVVVCWWELRNGAHVGVFCYDNGRVCFLDLSSGLLVGELSFPHGIESSALHYLDNKIGLFVVGQGKKSSVILETSTYIYPLDALVVSSSDFAGSRRFEPRSRLKGLRTFSAEAIANIKQKIAEKTRGVPAVCSSSEERHDLIISEFEHREGTLPFNFNQELSWMHYDDESGTVTEYNDKAILGKHLFSIGEEIRGIFALKTPHRYLKSDALHLQDQDNDEVGEDNRPLFMKKDVSIEDIEFSADTVLDSCLVWTSKGFYAWNPKYPIKVLLTYVAVELNPLDGDVFRSEMIQLSKAFGTPLSEVYLMAADIRLTRKEFPQAIALYRLSKCSHVQTALRFATSGNIPELLNVLHVLWTSKGVFIPQQDRIQLANLAVIGYSKLLNRASGGQLEDRCRTFLVKRDDYDPLVALKTFSKANLWSFSLFVSLRNGLQHDLILSLLSESPSSAVTKDFLLCLSEPSLQPILLVNGLLEIHFSFIEALMPSLDSDIVKRLLELYSCMTPAAEAFYDKLCDICCKMAIYSNDLFQVPPLKVTMTVSPVNCVLSCGYGSVVASYNNNLIAWGMGPVGTLDRSPKCGGPEYQGQCAIRFFQILKLKILSIACGREHCIVVTDRGVFGWGESKFGQLGLGDIRRQKDPRRLDFNEDSVDVAVGMYHSLLKTKQGRVYSFGWGVHGQLGHGSSLSVRTPKLVKSLSNVETITAGYCHSSVLTSQKKIFIFGNSYYGQAGMGESKNIYLPMVLDLADPALISSGYFFTIVLTNDGNLHVCGSTPMMIKEQNFQQKRTRILNAKKNLETTENICLNVSDTNDIQESAKEKSIIEKDCSESRESSKDKYNNRASESSVTPFHAGSTHVECEIQNCNISESGCKRLGVIDANFISNKSPVIVTNQHEHSTRSTNNGDSNAQMYCDNRELTETPKVTVSYAEALRRPENEPPCQDVLKKDVNVIGLIPRDDVPNDKLHLWPRRMDLRALGRETIVKITCSANQIVLLTDKGNIFGWKPKIGLTQVEFKEEALVFEDIGAGLDFCVARDRLGELWSWGNNSLGQLGFLPSLESQKEGRSILVRTGVNITHKVPLSGNCVNLPQKINFQ
ncbi:uncharacterized protein LOC136032969 isoform X2 [Artemia franciscana]|uniref:Uncharacterized protein n=1 Tax=Artemia franciscana TaxID=6661 RepID=A0AA88IKA2_ARTSF|nr:hypothetical protein QYM36_001681 [Artemia franciscana]